MLLTVEDLKGFINAKSTIDDVELYDFLRAAEEVVQALTGPMEAHTVSETHYAVSSDVIALRQAPVKSVEGVSGRSYGVTFAAWTPDFVVLDTTSGLLRRADGGRFLGDVTISYTTGLAQLPGSVRLAILVVAGHLWETQRGAASPRGTQQPGQMPASGSGYTLPNRAVELLEPYVQGPRVA